MLNTNKTHNEIDMLSESTYAVSILMKEAAFVEQSLTQIRSLSISDNNQSLVQEIIDDTTRALNVTGINSVAGLEGVIAYTIKRVIQLIQNVFRAIGSLFKKYLSLEILRLRKITAFRKQFPNQIPLDQGKWQVHPIQTYALDEWETIGNVITEMESVLDKEAKVEKVEDYLALLVKVTNNSNLVKLGYYLEDNKLKYDESKATIEPPDRPSAVNSLGWDTQLHSKIENAKNLLNKRIGNISKFDKKMNRLEHEILKYETSNPDKAQLERYHIAVVLLKDISNAYLNLIGKYSVTIIRVMDACRPFITNN